jgi:Na+/melibiose symporter-like transporter
VLFLKAKPPSYQTLPRSVILAYAAPRIAFGIMGTLFVVYFMKFATDVLLIAPAVIGTILAIGRLWDGVTDPLIGYLSDRTRSPIGRRRIWLFAASVPMGLSLIGIWSPPEFLEGIALITWMMICLLLYETAQTAFYVPHGALSVELSMDYHERTRLYGLSHMIGIFGVAAGLVSLELMDRAEDKRLFAFQLSMFAASCITVLVIWTTFLLPERTDFQGRAQKKPFQTFLDILRNPHARLLLFVYGIETFGGATLGILAAYAAEYVVKMESLVIILVVYQLPQFLFAPLWIHLSKLSGKRNLWILGTLISAISFGSLYFAGAGDDFYVYCCCFFAGVGGGAGAVLPPSIQADVVDYDEYLTGERKEGAYLAVWNLVRKIAGSVTAFIVGIALQLSGFEPNVEQSEVAQNTIRGLLALMPCLCYIIGAIFLFKFSFNEKEHREVSAVLIERRSTRKTDLPTGTS